MSKRVVKEFGELQKNPPPGMSISVPDEADMNKWKITIDGPDGTPFKGGKFTLLLTLPPEYPFKPPTISFQTKIYHPNVSNDEKGAMCLGILKPEEWKPATKLMDVLYFTMNVVREPNPDDAVEANIAAEYKEKRSTWEKNARDWTKKYASGK